MSRYLQLLGSLYATDYARRLKTCMNCGTQFSDVTKRNLLHTCTRKCQQLVMVAKRHANGNYAQTEEQKEKKRISCKATYASRDVFSPELRVKFSETMKKNWREGKIDTANHWSKTPEGKARLSAISLGRKLGPQPNMSLGAQRRLRTKRETLYTSAHGGTREDLGMYFRSNWEANFARILNLQGKRWTYEERTFQLTPSLSYTPDFYVIDDDCFYELKGRMDDKARHQLELMHDMYSNVVINVIEGAKYRQLGIEWKHLIPTWEGK